MAPLGQSTIIMVLSEVRGLHRAYIVCKRLQTTYCDGEQEKGICITSALNQAAINLRSKQGGLAYARPFPPLKVMD